MPNETLQPTAATSGGSELKGLVLAAAAERWRSTAQFLMIPVLAIFSIAFATAVESQTIPASLPTPTFSEPRGICCQVYDGQQPHCTPGTGDNVGAQYFFCMQVGAAFTEPPYRCDLTAGLCRIVEPTPTATPIPQTHGDSGGCSINPSPGGWLLGLGYLLALPGMTVRSRMRGGR